VRAVDDEARRLSGRMKRRALQHEPPGRGDGERTACDREREASPTRAAYRHPCGPPWREPIEPDSGEKRQRELSWPAG
jgi:hypothetical protein